MSALMSEQGKAAMERASSKQIHDSSASSTQTLVPEKEEALCPTNLSTEQCLTEFKSDLVRLRSLATCSICDQLLYEPWTLACGHTYCYSCLCSWFEQNQRKKTCPDCRAVVKQIPAPSFVIKQMVAVLMQRLELMPPDESFLQHTARQAEEAATVETDRKDNRLFKDTFATRSGRLMLDESDGVLRCPECGNEHIGGLECDVCGLWLSEDGFSDMSDFRGEDLEDLEQDLDFEDGFEPDDDDFSPAAQYARSIHRHFHDFSEHDESDEDGSHYFGLDQTDGPNTAPMLGEGRGSRAVSAVDGTPLHDSDSDPGVRVVGSGRRRAARGSTRMVIHSDSDDEPPEEESGTTPSAAHVGHQRFVQRERARPSNANWGVSRPVARYGFADSSSDSDDESDSTTRGERRRRGASDEDQNETSHDTMYSGVRPESDEDGDIAGYGSDEGSGGTSRDHDGDTEMSVSPTVSASTYNTTGHEDVFPLDLGDAHDCPSDDSYDEEEEYDAHRWNGGTMRFRSAQNRPYNETRAAGPILRTNAGLRPPPNQERNDDGGHGLFSRHVGRSRVRPHNYDISSRGRRGYILAENTYPTTALHTARSRSRRRSSTWDIVDEIMAPARTSMPRVARPPW